MGVNSYLYSIPYVILFCILFVLYKKECGVIARDNGSNTQKELSKIRLCAFATLLFFIGLRGHIYTDFTQYYLLFESIPSIDTLDVSEFNMESGFLVYTSLFKTFIPNYFCWIFFNTLIDLFVLFNFFRKNTISVVLACLVFVSYQGLYFEFNLYRNVKALMLFILSIPYLIERKPLKFFLLNGIGCFFHIGSLLYFFCYFFCGKNWSKKAIWSLFLVANVSFLLKIHFTSEVLGYLSNVSSAYLAFKATKYAADTGAYGLSFGYLEKTIVVLLIMMNYVKLTNKNKIKTLLCNFSFLFYFITYFFSDISILTERLSYMFIFSLWIVLSDIIIIEKKTIISSAILFLLFIRLAISNMTILCYYDNLLWGIRDYDQRSSVISRYYR